MPALALPYQPLRTGLYSPGELLGAFDPARPDTFLDTTDFAIYAHHVREGGLQARTYFDVMMESLHDTSISAALSGLLGDRRCVALMGSHKLARTAPEYARMARVGSDLARRGFLVLTGGGPGAMEAAHLGAALARHAPADLEEALRRLAAAPTLPALKAMVPREGAPDPALVKAAHAWYAPAIALSREIRDPVVSVGVPTWHHGHEPSAPFATHLAKYFQNSVREDGLLALALHGVIFTPGHAGTVQEIFQDAAQNYYESFRWFSPMVLLDVRYWTAVLPVVPVLEALFGDRFRGRVLVTDDERAAVDFVEAFAPPH